MTSNTQSTNNREDLWSSVRNQDGTFKKGAKRFPTPEFVKIKISIANKGKHRGKITEEQRQKLKISLKKYWKEYYENNPRQPLPKCRKCGKELKTLGALKCRRCWMLKYEEEKKCPKCGKIIWRKSKQCKTCLHTPQRVEDNCDYCGKKFVRPRSLSISDRFHKRKNIFCNNSCYYRWMKEVRKTEEHPLYRGIGDKNAKLYRERAKKRNPEKFYKVKRDNAVVYRVRRRGLGGSMTKQEWLDMKEAARFECCMCKRREPEIKLVADHIVPVVRWEEWATENKPKYRCGDKDNIQPLCISCNCKKNTKLPEELKD